MKFRPIALNFTILTGLLLLASSLRAQPPDCSGLSLHGGYQLSASSGTNGLLNFDASGAMSGDYLVRAGTGYTSATLEGTYELSPNCTGSTDYTTSTGDSYQVNFTTDPQGKQLRFENTDPAKVLAGTARQTCPICPTGAGGPFTYLAARCEPALGSCNQNSKAGMAAQAGWQKKANGFCHGMCPGPPCRSLGMPLFSFVERPNTRLCPTSIQCSATATGQNSCLCP
jgi:hypothetical protein